MDSKDKFIKTVGSRFWNHIIKNTDLPIAGDIPDRVAFLTALHQKLVDMDYVPGAPRGYIVAPKHNLVARFIPALKLQDYCVYFYCLKLLEEDIAKNRVSGTYGGFRLGGAIRRLEDDEEAAEFGEEYQPDHSYNMHAWRTAWKDFQGKAYRLYRKEGLNYYAVFDIANFYDSVKFDRLETAIRETVDRTKTPVVDLLFYFLRNANRKYLGYSPNTLGLPQDEVGDCSRILANFYLQDYDSFVFKICKAAKAKYLRYADDQIIAAQDEAGTKELMFRASKELVKYGLNLNASKAQFFTKEDFGMYWSFDIFKMLNTEVVFGDEAPRAFAMFEKRLEDGVKLRSITLIRRFLSLDTASIRQFLPKLLELALREENITQLNAYYLGRIYRHLPTNDLKLKYIKRLNELSGKILYNQFHLRVLSFAKLNKLDPDLFNEVNINLKRLESFD